MALMTTDGKLTKPHKIEGICSEFSSSSPESMNDALTINLLVTTLA